MMDQLRSGRMTHLPLLLRNALTLLRCPTMAVEYFQFQLSRVRHGGEAVRYFPVDGFEVGNLSGFSEYWSCAEYISSAERTFLREYPFGAGPLLDVGGNLGIFSLTLARRFPERSLHAFEPNSTTYAAMSANFARNGCCHAHAHAMAVAAHEGEITFQTDALNRATTHIASGENTAPGSTPLVRVPCTTLDGFVKREGIVDIALLKVDVEGYEELVFCGAEELLSSGRAGVIYYEVCPDLARRAGFDPGSAGRRLLSHGYRLHMLDDRGGLVPVDISRAERATLENWVAVQG